MEVGFKGVDCSKYFSSHCRILSERKRATVFLGSDWIPNNQAVEVICSQISPSLPDWEHWIVGSCSRYASDNVASEPNYQRIWHKHEDIILYGSWPSCDYNIFWG